MVIRLLRPLLAILAAIALVGAPAAQAVAAVPCGAVHMTVVDHQASTRHAQTPVPCKGMTPACVDALGCVSNSLAAPENPAGGPLTWTPTIYWAGADAREGRSIEPALDPPIPFT
ncbi:hypothetical protein [Siccirubricoccus soli]|uniref:hypothetical protein n=1 Tax=Siccirubricoccus soli TaxID=2899147 RepID=UPI00209447B0|nr:hypothetical protein [Siccirubricoccus soli]